MFHVTSSRGLVCLFVPCGKNFHNVLPLLFSVVWLKVELSWGDVLSITSFNGDAKSMTSLLSQFAPSGVNIILLSFTHLAGLSF